MCRDVQVEAPWDTFEIVRSGHQILSAQDSVRRFQIKRCDACRQNVYFVVKSRAQSLDLRNHETGPKERCDS